VNILFANYGDFTTNSLNHIGGFANTLQARGHACIVAVPGAKDTDAALKGRRYATATFSEILSRPACFPDGRVADVIHAWTPRECVRKFVIGYQQVAHTPAKLVVHLEDNEAELFRSFAGCSADEAKNLSYSAFSELLNDRLPHPFRHRAFTRLADHVTVIIDRLRETLPAGLESTLVFPGVDPAYFGITAPVSLRAELGIRPGERVISFTGSNTFANEADMRVLYEAVALLNERGTPTRLVRTGFNRPEFQQALNPRLKAAVLDLGFIAKERLPALLALADVLVQPGSPGPFNDYRLPSKLPEFLASGRPTVMPATNIGLLVADGKEAVLLKGLGPEAIVEACLKVFGAPDLGRSLGQAGAAFARKHFDVERTTDTLLSVYTQVLGKATRPVWDVIRDNAVTEVTAAAVEVAGALRDASKRTALNPPDALRLADDLTAVIRLIDEQEWRSVAARDSLRMQLEEKVRHLEMQRDLTQQHVQNLQEKVESQERHAKLQKRLSDRHIQNLEARISGVEKIAREQAEKAAAQLDEAGRAHRKLADRVLELDAETTERERRLKAVQQSLSWRLMAPVRDLQRLAGRILGKGTSLDTDPRPVVPLKTEVPAPVSPAPAPEAPAAPIEHHYTFNFDHPRDWNTASNKLLILGWCYENAAAPILGIRARFAGQLIEGIYGSKRLDVLASTGMKQAEYCGIKIDVPTHLGDHPLIVEVKHAEGWNPFFQTLVHVGKPGDPAQQSEYEKWCEQHEHLEQEDLTAIARHIESFLERPVISVVMPVYNPPEELLVKAIASVEAQLYPHWELCIADDASTQPHVRPVLERYAAKDTRIKVTYRESNGHICEASNTALGLATGSWVALFDHDDVLNERALYEVAAEIDRHPNASLIYSDEDKIDLEDRRFDPYFKPDWNPDLNYAQNYLSHLTVYRGELIRSLGGFRKGYEGSQDWDLILRAIEKIPPGAIRHIPKLLYHWRATPGSTALQLAEKSYPVDAARRALADHFSRLGLAVDLSPVPGDHWRVKFPVPSPAPLVSLIIPTRNAVKLVRQAVKSVLQVTDYPNFEILIVDNGSDDPETLAYFEDIKRGTDPRLRVLPYPKPFNYSAINNFAVGEARGEILCFLNNDVEAIAPGWLTEMVSQASRPGVGAVGAMLYYPLNTIQHAGVILGLGGVAGHPFKEFPRGDQGQKNRLRLVQNYSAVTAACLAIRKDRFLAVGGFNERDLAVAFNDVDLCCKLIESGLRNVWTPHAEFYHHESATRGVEDTPEKKARFQAEIDYMMNTWGSLLMADPAYNPNLTLVGEDFSPAYLSRVTKSWAEYLS
jgi:O-antigen biosynthesis protein